MIRLHFYIKKNLDWLHTEEIVFVIVIVTLQSELAQILHFYIY